MGDGGKRRSDPRESAELVQHTLNKLTAEGYVVEGYEVAIENGDPRRGEPVLPIGATLTVRFTTAR